MLKPLRFLRFKTTACTRPWLKHMQLALLATMLATTSCGKKSSGGKGTPVKLGKVDAAFQKASREHGVPLRFLMAVGFLESRLSPENAMAHYASLQDEGDETGRGTVMTQTAFGLTSAMLWPEGAPEDSNALSTQIDAYAKVVSEQVKDLSLVAQPRTQEEKFRWVEALANIHRSGLKQRRNVQIIFAKELIQTLNDGFLWQDPNDASSNLRLDAENPPIKPAELKDDGKNWFNLDTLTGQFYGVSYLPLVTVADPNGLVNKPRRVEVIHCPLSLSACLELQTQTACPDEQKCTGESDVHLSAHYVIPQDKTIVENVLQVADQSEAVIQTNKRGENYHVQDAIIIMLVGNPGRIVAGKRYPAIPSWFSDAQLRALGRIVNDVCTSLAQKTPDLVNRDTCMSTSSDLGVQFRTQGESEEYRWGDIADFDATIFQAYLRSPDGLGTEVAFKFDSKTPTFNQGQKIPLNLSFNATARTIELERLVRCHNDKVVWETVGNPQVRGKTSASFDNEALYDSGPNRNGDHFYRARVYGKDGKLVGWAISQVYLRTYEKEIRWPSDKFCDQKE